MWLAGNARLAAGDKKRAQQHFLDGLAVAEDMGARRWLWPILGALYELETTVNHTTAAQQHRQQAQEIIAFIADNAGSDELRVSFLAQPEVHHLSAEKA